MKNNQRPQGKWKRYWLLKDLFKTCLALTLVIGINSCKKEIISPFPDVTKSINDKKINVIKYSDFLEKINLNKTGTLKNALLKTNSNKTSSTNSNSSVSFNLDMSNVKELIIKDTISYVIALKPRTPHAVQFQNITIQIAKGKTTAFLTTYIPTKAWIAAWRKKGQTDSVYRGEFYVDKLDLSEIVNIPINKTGSATNSTNSLISKASYISIGDNKIKLLPGECEFYDIWETIYYSCSTGHNYRWECDYFTEFGTWDLIDGNPHFPPREEVSYVGQGQRCEPGLPPPTVPGDGGGGGNTTPNPPGDYDPCDDPPLQSSIKGKNSFNLLTVPPPPCDENPPYNPNAPVYVDGEWVSTTNYPGLVDGYPYRWWEDEEWLVSNFDLSGNGENLTVDELFLIAAYPGKALFVKLNATKATNMTIAKFGYNGRNDKSDAFRHALWNALNTRDISEINAKAFGDAHESETTYALEKSMDLFNNSVGRDLGTAGTDATLATSVTSKLNNGSLRYISNLGSNGLATSTSQLIPTNQ